MNVISNLMCNLLDMGVCKMDNSYIGELVTKDSDYKIIMKRKNTLWSNNLSFKYICSIEFYNMLGIKVFELNLNENDIAVIVDNIACYIDFNMMEIAVPVISCDINMINHNIQVYKEPPYYDIIHILEISDYNPQFQTLTKRIRIRFDDEILYNFIDELYMTFLVGDERFKYINENYPMFE